MANIYVDSNATGSATGADWANAYLTLAAAAAVDNAGDIIWVAHNHSESTAGSLNLVWAGTAASPTRIICANSGSGEPPTTLATTASVSTTSSGNSIVNSADSLYVYGIIFTANTSASGGGDIVWSNNFDDFIHIESCSLRLDGNNGSATIHLGGGSTGGTHVRVENCTFRFGAATQGLELVRCNSMIIGGSILSGGTAPTQFIGNGTSDRGIYLLISGFDFSQANATLNICNIAEGGSIINVQNCKMPSSWSGQGNGSTGGSGTVISLHNSSSTDTNYELVVDSQFGTIVHETTLVKSGGASDGTTSISWEMTTNADAEWSHQTLDSPEIVRWNETTGSSVTLTVDILHDSATNLQDDEIWLEVQYLGTSGFPLSLFVDDAAATYTTTAADQTTSAATWTTTGMSNPNEQKLAVTFTPQEKGYFIAKVKIAKASYTCYVDPVLQVS